MVREGLSSDSWKCLWANDISEVKEKTYVANFGNEHFVVADIWDVASHSDNLPTAFLYTATFPCTDLSLAGNRAGLAGANSGTVNALFKILNLKQKQNKKPKVIMLENVKGFLTSNNGQDCRATVKLFSEMNYYVDILEIDACYFTPQSRQRVFMIAVEKSLAKEVMRIKDVNYLAKPWLDLLNSNATLRSKHVVNMMINNPKLNWGLFDIEFNMSKKTNLSTIIDLSVKKDSHLWWNNERKEHLLSQMNTSHSTTLNNLMNQNRLSYGTLFRRTRKGVCVAEMRIDGIAGCLRTPKGGSSKQIIIEAGFGSWRVRLLNPREYARLQGVRDSFILPNNSNEGLFAMGDAVCVLAIEFLSKEILSPTYNTWFKMDLLEKSIAGGLNELLIA